MGTTVNTTVNTVKKRGGRKVKESRVPPEFVLSELKRLGIRGKMAGSHYMIACPFHDDKNPSCGVSLGDKVPAGVFHCLACEEKGGWNKLALKIGARTWDASAESEIRYVSRKKIDKNSGIDEDELILSEWDGVYKRYSREFLRQFGVKKLWDAVNMDYYMYVPITYMGDLTGYVKARLHEDSPGPKYWYPASVKKSLYPVDYMMKKNSKTVVLVEGLGDVFRCLENGIPALALLGLKATDFMMEQLEVLGVKSVILCLDGDEAGRRGTFGFSGESGNRVSGLVERMRDYEVRVLPLPDGDGKCDPDSMPDYFLDVLKYLVLETGGELLGVA